MIRNLSKAAKKTNRGKTATRSDTNPVPATIGIISLGCAKNLVDSETMAAAALAEGFTLASRPETADIVLINTCAFIRDAQQESINTILEACKWKASGRCRAVMVCGCMPQRYQSELADELPEVDAFIGLDAVPEAGLILRRIVAGERHIRHVTLHAKRLIHPPATRPIFTNGTYAFLKIAEGCDNHCAYCVIPDIRGTLRSRKPDLIVREAELLLQRGVRELNLIAQDTTAYGADLGRGDRLPGLLRALDKLGGHFWIRVLYSHPGHITEKLVETIGELTRVCKYLDLPIQHSHPEVLKAMCRPIPADGMEGLFNRIRKIIPDITLRTTCLVGFPGETSQRFKHLMQFSAAMRFDHLGVFKYSAEDGTRAAELPHRVSPRVMRQREQQLMLQQRRLVFRRNRTRIGRRDKFLLENPAPRRPGVFIARAADCAPEVDGITFLLNAPAGSRPGQFVNARYTRARGYDMEATA